MENEIKILVADGCTKAEAERHLQRGTIVFEQGEIKEHLANYMAEWGVEAEEVEAYRKMVDGGELVPDWGRVKYNGNTYLIMYVL